MQRNPNLPSALTETQTKPSPGRCPPGTPTRRQALGRLPTPPPLPENLLSDCTENCPLRPCEHPGGFGIRKSASNSGHSPLRGLGGGLGGGLGDASPARRGSRSRPPLRRPRPLRFARLRVPVWNPYSRGRLSPAKSEDRKGGEGKTDANLTIFFSTCCAWSAAPPRWPPGRARCARREPVKKRVVSP